MGPRAQDAVLGRRMEGIPVKLFLGKPKEETQEINE